MKLATYSTSDDATLKVGLVRDKELVPLENKSVEGGMMSLLQAGIDINAIEVATKGKPGLPLSSVTLHAPGTAARKNTCPWP